MTKTGIKMSVDINEYNKYKERMKMNENEETGNFEHYMLEICDLLENGDVAIDFAERDQPHEATVIRIIADIVRNELEAIRVMNELHEEFQAWLGQKDDDKEATE
tara:strand:+ start:693 stop:1007 length:315 start_codon:yes stop_codon:yes gene_type:complete